LRKRCQTKSQMPQEEGQPINAQVEYPQHPRARGGLGQTSHVTGKKPEVRGGGRGLQHDGVSRSRKRKTTFGANPSRKSFRNEREIQITAAQGTGKIGGPELVPALCVKQFGLQVPFKS